MEWTNIWRPAVRVKQNYFEQKIIAFVARLFTLHLVSFVSKSVNYLSRTEHVKIQESSCLASILLQKRQNITFDGISNDSVLLE